MIREALEDLRAALRSLFSDKEVSAVLSWEVSGRAVSEIGGRLIEDFVLNHIHGAWKTLRDPVCQLLDISVPTTGRTAEDFRVQLGYGEQELHLLVDVKGHNEYRRGSRPNLASIRKAIDLYGDPARSSEEIVIFFCRYRPTIDPTSRGSHLPYDILPESFDEKGVFPLRWLSRANLDPANIGSGGQILLAREDRIVLQERSRTEFVSTLQELQGRALARPRAIDIADVNPRIG